MNKIQSLFLLAIVGAAAAVPVSGYLGDRNVVKNCNAGLEPSCVEIIDTKPVLRPELDEKGEANLLEIEDSRLRAGEGLKSNHSRFIRADGHLTPDQPFVATYDPVSFDKPIAAVRITWREGDPMQFYLDDRGTGQSSYLGHERNSHVVNWHYEGSDLHIITQSGETLFLGGQRSRLNATLETSRVVLAESRRAEQARQAAEQAERERQEELGAQVLQGIFSSVFGQ
jgi:hypothetical protein